MLFLPKMPLINKIMNNTHKFAHTCVDFANDFFDRMKLSYTLPTPAGAGHQ